MPMVAQGHARKPSFLMRCPHNRMNTTQCILMEHTICGQLRTSSKEEQSPAQFSQMAATPIRTQTDDGWSDGRSSAMIKLVEAPVVLSVPVRAEVLYSGHS